MGIDEGGLLGLILKKFSGYFCCYFGRSKMVIAKGAVKAAAAL